MQFSRGSGVLHRSNSFTALDSQERSEENVVEHHIKQIVLVYGVPRFLESKSAKWL